MHQTRSEVIRQLPLARKGTKYIARALRNSSDSVPLIVAIRDMLKLASTSKEVKGMVHNKKIKINGKNVKDVNEPICLFSILEADKNYLLNLLPTGRFDFVETKEKDRKLKIKGKVSIKKEVFQYSLHDGTNVLSNKNFSVGDTLILSNDNKIVKHIEMSKGKEIFVIAGNYMGKTGKVEDIFEDNRIKVKFDNGSIVLEKAQIILI